MRRTVLFTLALASVLMTAGCSGYNKIVKSADYSYKYEYAKSLFVQGKYANSSSLLEECVIMLRGTAEAEECIFMLATCYTRMEDWIMAAQYYQNYYKSFPNGEFREECRFMSGKCLYHDTPDPRLDPTSTYGAINELQQFLELYPYSEYADEANVMIYEMYDRLVEKELKTATLYYNLGNYMGNNYRSSIITAQNALKDYPYTKYREDLSIIILRSKYQMAVESVADKMLDRYRDTIDEYYAFMNEFPESKYAKEAEKIFRNASKNVGNYN